MVWSNCKLHDMWLKKSVVVLKVETLTLLQSYQNKSLEQMSIIDRSANSPM